MPASAKISPKLFTLDDAICSRAQLEDSIRRIRRQIGDPNRALRFGSEDAYRQWRTSARRALDAFRDQHAEVLAWMCEELGRMLGESAALFAKLKSEEVDFCDEEEASIGKINEAIASLKEEQGQ